MRIAYIIESLAFNGGTERMLTEKANYLAERYGVDVYIVTCVQEDSTSNSFRLSAKVKQVNLNIPFYSQYRYRYPMRLWVKMSVNRKLKKAVADAVREIDPDIIMAVCHYKADMVSALKCRAKKVIECHEIRSFTLSGASQHHTRLTELYMQHYRKRYFSAIEHRADVVVTLTEGDKKLWKNARRVEVIPNFSTMAVTQLSNGQAKQVIAVGRLEKEKGHERLLKAWELVWQRHPDWHLDIFGNGSLRGRLDKLIGENHLTNVTIHQATSDIDSEYRKSSICVMTSFCEGFALVLLEALKHGVPCVAYDCPYGPRSIIKDNLCGFLVEDGNTDILVEKLCTLIEDAELRKRFSGAAVNRAGDFNKDIIMDRWITLFNELTTI